MFLFLLGALIVNDTTYAVEGFGEAEPPQDLHFSGGMCRQSRHIPPERDDSWRASSPPNLPARVTAKHYALMPLYSDTLE
jgi:hypothetical protein